MNQAYRGQPHIASEFEHRGRWQHRPQEVETVELLERLLKIVKDRTFCIVYDDVAIAITYDIGDGDNARRILEAMDDHASEQGFDDAAAMVAHYRGEN